MSKKSNAEIIETAAELLEMVQILGKEEKEQFENLYHDSILLHDEYRKIKAKCKETKNFLEQKTYELRIAMKGVKKALKKERKKNG